MRINFILPEVSEKPVGGFKLVYQYANFFVQQGHNVAVYHKLGASKKITPNFLRSFKRKISWYSHKLSIDWFNIDGRVKVIPGVYRDSQVRNADITVATAVTTANFTNNLRKATGRKFYFIQNYENWGGYSDQMVDSTYRLPMHKVVISSWLADCVERVTNERPLIVPNFISENDFYNPETISLRGHVVSLLNHTQKTKRTQFGLDVLKEVQKQIPDLKVQLFGTYSQPDNLPKWVEYHYQPSRDELRNEIYGKSKVYLMPTVLEGWGLTGMEAMACGAVPVASNYGGMRDFMIDNQNSKLIAKDNKSQFVKAVVALLEDDDYCQKLSFNALHITQSFSIQKSATKFLNFFTENS